MVHAGGSIQKQEKRANNRGHDLDRLKSKQVDENCTECAGTAIPLRIHKYAHPSKASKRMQRVKPQLHDASNTSNVGHWQHSTHRVVAEVRTKNDERPATNIGVGR